LLRIEAEDVGERTDPSYRTNLTEANLRYHPLKASALYPAGG
jgi:hypothetical protein